MHCASPNERTVGAGWRVTRATSSGWLRVRDAAAGDPRTLDALQIGRVSLDALPDDRPPHQGRLADHAARGDDGVV